MSPTEAHPVEAVGASVASRVLALIVDAILLTALLFVAAAGLSAIAGPAVTFPVSPTSGGDRVAVDAGRAMIVGVVSAAISAAYFVGSWVARSATPGQGLLGIRVRHAAGGPLPAGALVVRWLFLMGPLSLGSIAAIAMPRLRPAVDPLTLAWALLLALTTIVSRDRRGLHDRAAGSVVTRSTRAAERRAAA